MRLRKRTTEIIIHCSDTQEGVNVTAADIRRWHTTPREKGGRGWDDIGYHYVVSIYGELQFGRDPRYQGAHCAAPLDRRKPNGPSHNQVALGICYIGGRHITEDGGWQWADTRTEAQKRMMLVLVTAELLRYGLTTDAVHGHNEFSAKACPCFDVRKWVKEELEPYIEREAERSRNPRLWAVLPGKNVT
ncbi:MAG: N-acetylmuramoyl-L-alanine amidase [Prevotella sp.]|nr:N-acetylmuramoyl-L-alanine amidase [Prevotella sp.]